jgi:hypothetical protein
VNHLVILFLVLATVLAIVIAWIVGEAKNLPALRRCAGVGFLLVAVLSGVAVGSLNVFAYNAWYGGATRELMDETIRQLERGNAKAVTETWTVMRADFAPTYENRARYDQLVKAAVAAMQSRSTPAP